MTKTQISRAIATVQAQLAACKTAGKWERLQAELRTLRAIESAAR